jgi:cytochrome c-type biogenesis protein
MFEIGYISALVGGILTFLAPCTLPLIPAYIGFLAGADKDENARTRGRRIMLNALLFTFAFSVVFVFFGLVSGVIGQFFVLHRALISRIGGILVIIFGLSMLGVFDMPRFFSGRKMPKFLTPGKPVSSFLLGLLFALGWSPCLGPILGTILVLAGTGGAAAHGATLLFVYSLGLAIPFLLVAAIYGASFSYITSLAKLLPAVNKAGGVLFVFIGLLLLMGNFGLLNVWVTDVFGDTWYTGLMDRM